MSFILGMVVGACLGLFVFAALSVASRSDAEAEAAYEERRKATRKGEVE